MIFIRNALFWISTSVKLIINISEASSADFGITASLLIACHSESLRIHAYENFFQYFLHVSS